MKIIQGRAQRLRDFLLIFSFPSLQNQLSLSFLFQFVSLNSILYFHFKILIFLFFRFNYLFFLCKFHSSFPKKGTKRFDLSATQLNLNRRKIAASWKNKSSLKFRRENRGRCYLGSLPTLSILKVKYLSIFK